MEVTTIGIDLAKSVFAVCGADARGKVVVRKQLRRAQLAGFMSQLKPCVVGMEACGGAHYWARRFAAAGHTVRLMSPALVAPYRKGNKTDRNDAEAICEAVTRPTMRFVAVKSVAQQDLLALHRVRAQLVKQRIALTNQIRAMLHERGMAIAKGAAGLKRGLAQALAADDDQFSGELRELVGELNGWLREFERRIAGVAARIARHFRDDERCARLAAVPGVGPLCATALVATVGNAREFKSGRELSAYLGLVPRQHSSGGRTVLLGISKHGDRYLRTLFIHGARAALHGQRFAAHPRGRWAARIMAARGPNVAAVALANKNVRIACALLRSGARYHSELAVVRPGPPAGDRRARVEPRLTLRRH